MYCMEASRVATIVPHIRPVGIIFLMAKVTVHKCAGIIQGRVFHLEVQIEIS